MHDISNISFWIIFVIVHKFFIVSAHRSYSCTYLSLRRMARRHWKPCNSLHAPTSKWPVPHQFWYGMDKDIDKIQNVSKVKIPRDVWKTSTENDFSLSSSTEEFLRKWSCRATSTWLLFTALLMPCPIVRFIAIKKPWEITRHHFIVGVLFLLLARNVLFARWCVLDSIQSAHF